MLFKEGMQNILGILRIPSFFIKNIENANYLSIIYGKLSKQKKQKDSELVRNRKEVFIMQRNMMKHFTTTIGAHRFYSAGGHEF